MGRVVFAMEGQPCGGRRSRPLGVGDDRESERGHLLRNHKREAVEVTIIEPVPGDWDLLKSSHPYEKIEAHTLKYKVIVPADGKTTVSYRVRMTW